MNLQSQLSINQHDLVPGDRVNAASSALRNETLVSQDRLSLLEFALRVIAEAVGSPRAIAMLAPNGRAVVCARYAEGAASFPEGDLGNVAFPASDEEVVRWGDTARVDRILASVGMEGGQLVSFLHSSPPGAFALAPPVGNWTESALAASARLAIIFDVCWAWRDANDRFQQTVADLEDALFSFSYDSNGERLYSLLTPQVRDITGIDVAGWLDPSMDWRLARLVIEDDRDRFAAHEECLRNRQASTCDFRISTDNGELKWVRERGTPAHDAAGGVVISGLLTDVTAAKEAEGKLVEARRTAEHAAQVRMNFLTTMSHELRTPLGVIEGFGTLLQEELGTVDASSAVTEFLEAIRSNTQRALRLISRLFELSQAETNTLTLSQRSFDLATTVKRIAEARRQSIKRTGLELRLEVEKHSGLVNADEGRVEQILNQLVDNAVSFTDTGAVTIRCFPSDERHVSVEVQDTGAGIQGPHPEAVFEPFNQEERLLARSHGGTGLGLALASRLAARMGGSLSVESEKGRGSTFRLTFPIAA
ncbi:hypothetical protein BH23BAC4_BH23BAC4_12030 [soil metagenome]